ncbi:MAG: phosphatidate cytidylyltransferase [Ruminiclostridium sp.]|nr:phosphatidate cytidylyltransferase [Ruminiclostridium sp.]
MAKRLITAAIGVPIGILIIFLGSLSPHVMSAATDILSIMAVFEVLSAAKYTKYRSITVLSLMFSALLPMFFCYNELRNYAIPVAFLFLVLLFAFTLMRHKEIKFEELGFIAFISICIPFAISTLAFFCFQWQEHGIFLVVYTLVTAWVADGGAYFAGTFLGKHKLCPEISPKKTWEGFFGGLITAVIFAVMLGYGYELWDIIFTGSQHFAVNIPILVGAAVVSTFLGLLGDLIASLLKRQCGVKDFSEILPGHGGVMDRFDSVLFVAPFIYLLCKSLFPITEIVI